MSSFSSSFYKTLFGYSKQQGFDIIIIINMDTKETKNDEIVTANSSGPTKYSFREAKLKEISDMKIECEVKAKQIIFLDKKISQIKSKKQTIQQEINGLKQLIEIAQDLCYDTRLVFLFEFFQSERIGLAISDYLEDEYCLQHDWFYRDGACFGCMYDAINYEVPCNSLHRSHCLSGNVKLAIVKRGGQYYGELTPIHPVDREVIFQWLYAEREKTRRENCCRDHKKDRVNDRKQVQKFCVEIDNIDKLFKDPVRADGVAFITNFKPGVCIQYDCEHDDDDCNREMLGWKHDGDCHTFSFVLWMPEDKDDDDDIIVAYDDDYISGELLSLQQKNGAKVKKRKRVKNSMDVNNAIPAINVNCTDATDVNKRSRIDNTIILPF